MRMPSYYGVSTTTHRPSYSSSTRTPLLSVASFANEDIFLIYNIPTTSDGGRGGGGWKEWKEWKVVDKRSCHTTIIMFIVSTGCLVELC
mmetsp:Transcript_7447/g.13561  ORF Transcript_7447/g.13561 Transcript_7447/m.13561 type:complete len:89 (-) Transcript_7447:120-386(-)